MAGTHYQLLNIEPHATRAEIDAGLTRRENQYRELVRTGQRPDYAAATGSLLRIAP